MTNTSLLILAVLAQVALTFFLLIRLGRRRVAAVTRGEVKVGDIALGQSAWPDPITQNARSYASQFELPVLFYAAALLAIAAGKVDMVVAGGALAFAASRYVHAWVHVTSNQVPSRFRAFVTGVFILMGLWGWLGWRLLIEGA